MATALATVGHRADLETRVVIADGPRPMATRKKLPPNVSLRSDGTYRAIVRIRGERVYGPRRKTVTQASADVRAIRGEVSRVVGGHLTLGEVESLLLEDIAARGLSASTRTYYRNHWRVLLQHGWPAEHPVALITAKDVESYAAKRRVCGISESTIWTKELQVLDRALRLLVKRGVLDRSAVQDARKPTIRAARFGVLPRERVAECVDILRRVVTKGGGKPDGRVVRGRLRMAAMVELLFFTGIRRAELARLHVRDVEIAANRIFVRGKTGDRYVPLTALSLEAIRTLAGKKRMANPSATICGGVRAIERAFSAIQAATGEPLLTPHVLRHSFATEMVRTGVQPFVLSALMGHADTRQTARYFHIDGVDARAAMDAITTPPRDGTGS